MSFNNSCILCLSFDSYGAILVRKLQWRHNEDDKVSSHQPHDCLLNR